MGFDLLRPGFVWLLVLAPLAFVAGWLALARSRRELALWVAPRQRARFLPGVSTARARLRLVLGAAALAFLALAALGPVRGYTYRAVSRRGLDLVVCLDTSRSMLAQDLRPSRLERAKREIVGLLDLLSGDRVALVAFSGDARDVAPLTRDKETLRGLLAYVTPEDNREGGTDLAAAIEHALALFDGRTGAHEAIVLLTDGEDLEGKAAAQAEEAVKRNIRVFVVGVGTEAGGKIPIVDEAGRSTFLRDPDGNEVVSKLGRESLASLAARTGGDYLSAEQSPTPLEELYRKRVARIQGREIEGGERRVPYDRFQWPLALALVCLLAELVLRERGARRAEEQRAPRLAAALLPFALLGGEEPPLAYPHALEHAVELHKDGDDEQAEAAARALLAQADALALGDLERAKAHFALGVIASTRALAKDAKPEDAAAQRTASSEAFSAARALAGPGELRLDATYDLGALELAHAEEVRARIPEISGQPAGAPLGQLGAPGAPGAPAGTAPGATSVAPPVPPPDPLPEARELYKAARTWLVERLRLDWNDEDTRADLELIQRRLHELDEIEKKREQEKQKQQQDQKDPNQQQDSKYQKDQQDKDEKGKDQKDKDKQDQKGDQGKDGPDKRNPDKKNPDEKDDQKPQDEKDQQEKKDEPKPGEEQKPDEAKPQDQPEQKEGEQKDQAQPKPDQPQSERVLTREEVMQLLDKLSDLEKQQKALQAALRAKKRAATKRDW